MSRISRSVSGPRSSRWRTRFAFDELRDEESRAVVIADFVNGQDVGMIERGSGASLVQEAAHALRIAGELRPQHFERDRPPSVGSTAL